MHGFNVIWVFNSTADKVLMCKRRKQPYLGLYNLVGGKIESGEGSVSAAYRELKEETGIEEITLIHLMNVSYFHDNLRLEVYAGKLECDVDVFGNENELVWIDVTENFFDMSRFAGEGSIGHIFEVAKRRVLADESKNGKTSERQPFKTAGDGAVKSVTITPLTKSGAEQAAEILREAFPWCYGGENADEEMEDVLDSERIALAAIADNRIVGLIGAIPSYGVTGWELHPLAVLKEYRGHGIGSLLVEHLERETAARGGVTLYLGSDDEFGTTSLFGEDLYVDTFEKIANIKNINGHPFEFYEKCGYKLVGVLPDANGIGRPDIWMAKRIADV